ncbi:MAG: sulfatase [Deltaproteobacteria bacterium]|nr:sulfatase [Deltaproteobacteria bacterium]
MKNVILFTIDTLRRDVLGCYGDHKGLTPFLDSIQDNCIRFTRCQASGPYTQASFPAILSSSYFLEYVKTPQAQFSNKRTLISEVLKKEGIYTAAFHSNPYLSAYFGWNRGWDQFYDSMQDAVDDVNPYIKGNTINDKVNKWLSSYISGSKYKPFFLWVHYMDVHEPYAPDKRYTEKVDVSLELTKKDYLKLFKEVVLPRNTSNKETVKLLKKLYYAHVIEVDEYARMLFEILDKHGVLNESMVIITSDHGEEFDEHGSLSHDGKMYSELVHVPLMIYDPALDKGQVCNNLVSGVDIPPTILHLFGLQPYADFKGKSLVPVDQYISEGCFGECIGKLKHKMQPSDQPTYFYRYEDMKIIYREEGDSWEFYDLKADPGEKNNIFQSAQSAEEMEMKLGDFIKRNSQI